MNSRLIVFFKLAVAGVVIIALVSVPAKLLAPQVSLGELVLYVACAFVALVALAVLSLQLSQFILRRGGTDPQ